MPRSDLDQLDIQTYGPDGAPPVVLVHGAPDRATTFRALPEHLADLRLVAYDRRGYGTSVGAAPAESMADHAEDLIAVVERTGAPCVVVAHSFGSNPTMLAASERPELFASVGLWEPPTVWVEWWPQRAKDYSADVASATDPEDMIEEMYRRMLGERTWSGLTDEIQAQRRAEGHAFRIDMGSLLHEPFRFEGVTVPAVVGYGTETSDEHVAGAVWLADHLPDGELFPIEGAGHFANRTHPDAYARFVRAALSRSPKKI